MRPTFRSLKNEGMICCRHLLSALEPVKGFAPPILKPNTIAVGQLGAIGIAALDGMPPPLDKSSQTCSCWSNLEKVV